MKLSTLAFEDVCKAVPPVGAAYHLNMPSVSPIALDATGMPPQLEPGIVEGSGGSAFIVATTGVRGLLSQPALLKVT